MSRPSQLFVGVDIGGTKIRAVLCNSKKILESNTVATEAKKGKAHILKRLFEAIDSVYRRDVTGIGMGCPGPLDQKRGIIISTPNLPFRNLPLARLVSDRYDKKVLIDNDGNCFVLGEKMFGSAKGFRNVIGLTLGTGVGGGIVINNEIYHGRNNAGELGHISIKYDGRKSRFGNSGDLEEYVSARGLMRTSKSFGLRVPPEELFRLANKGNKKAVLAWKEFGKHLGIGITSLVHCFDPEVVVIGGSVSNAFSHFKASMLKELNQRVLVKPPRVVKSRLGANAVVLGAVSLFKLNLLYP